MIANLLDGIEVRLNTDYLENKAALDALADKIVYTGPIDAYFDYKLGTLEYRSVRFENELLDKPSFQATPPSTIRTARRRGPASSSTNGSSSARTRTATTCPKRSSAASIPLSGSPVTSRITPSTMLKTAHCMPSTRSWPTPSRRSSSADAWVSISITTWIRLSPPCWTAAKASCTKAQPSESTKFKRQQKQTPKAKIGVYFAALFYLLNPLAPLATTPPSIRMSAPVRKPSRSSRRSANKAAISSGFPLRLRAEYFLNTSACPLSSTPIGVSKLPGVTLRQRTFFSPKRAASVLANQITKCLVMA